MKVVSLFSGIGGFDLGFEQAGFETVVMAEFDWNCHRLLCRKFPKALQLGDVCAIGPVWKRQCAGKAIDEKWIQIFERMRAAPVWVGGFPCQDLSMAGGRAGLAGERSGVWFSFRRLIGLFRPPWVVIENVPGLLSTDSGRDFEELLSGLEKLGYWWAYRTLDAQYFGLAQRRERLFLVASFGTLGCAEVLFEPESVCGDSAPGRAPGEGTAPTLEERASRSGDAVAPATAAGGGLVEVAKAVRCKTGGVDQEDGHTLIATDAVSGAVSRKWAKGTGGPAGDECYVAFGLADDETSSEEMVPTLVPPSSSGGGHPGAIAFTERTRADGRNLEASEELAYAVSDPGAGGQAHSRRIAAPSGVRRLTPLECSRLQGFPDDWLDGLGFSDSTKYRMLGNAVAVPVAKWIATRLAKVINTQPKVKDERSIRTTDTG